MQMIYKGIVYEGTPAELAEVTRRIRVNEEMNNAPSPPPPNPTPFDAKLLQLGIGQEITTWRRR